MTFANKLRQQAREYRKRADNLERMAELAEQFPDHDFTSLLDSEATEKPPKVKPNGKGRKRPTKSSRIEQVKRVLREHGPLTRSEISKQHNIPMGTLSMILKTDSTEFVKIGERWGLPEHAAEAAKSGSDESSNSDDSLF